MVLADHGSANLTEGGDGDLRVSKIIEVPGTITVTYFNDGKEFASGSWTVETPESERSDEESDQKKS